jgi:hypothetical protein
MRATEPAPAPEFPERHFAGGTDEPFQFLEFRLPQSERCFDRVFPRFGRRFPDAGRRQVLLGAFFAQMQFLSFSLHNLGDMERCHLGTAMAFHGNGDRKELAR